MSYTRNFYSLLVNNVLFNIIPPNLTGGGGGSSSSPGGGSSANTTMPLGQVGAPERIPEHTFIGGPIGTDNFLNPARDFHSTYNLNPVEVLTMEEVVRQLSAQTSTLSCIRIITHADHDNLFFNLFDGLITADRGITEEELESFGHSDEHGLRAFLNRYFTATPSITNAPSFRDFTTEILDGIRNTNSTILRPFSLEVAGPPTGDIANLFAAFNDLWYLEHGQVRLNANPLNPAQKNTVETTLENIISDVSSRITRAAGSSITNTHITTVQHAILALRPNQMGLNVLDSFTFPNNSFVAAIQAVNTTGNQRQIDLRQAIVGGNNSPLITAANFTDRVLAGLRLFNAAALQPFGLRNGGNPNGNLLRFFQICGDLNLVEHHKVMVSGNLIGGTDKTALNQGLNDIASIIRNAAPANRRGDYDALKSAILQLTPGQMGALGFRSAGDPGFERNFNAANNALANNFRQNLDQVKARFTSSSFVDIRGCRVGNTNSFLEAVRTFFGATNVSNRPKVSAPTWFQTFDARTQGAIDTIAEINPLFTSGAGSGISASQVRSALTTWEGFVDFVPHYDFFQNLFGGTPIDFVAMDWRHWRTAGSSTGIPPLKMHAHRIEDIVTLNLDAIIDRFATIWEISSPPDATVRARLNSLQPFVAQFKTAEHHIINPSPGATVSNSDFTQLKAIADGITGIPGFAAPASPLMPATPPNPLDLSQMQGFAQNIRTHLTTILNADLATFMTAVHDQFQPSNASHLNRAKFQYYVRVGLPMLVQASSSPRTYRVINWGASGSADRDLSFKSWMKIQWTSTDANLLTAMNSHIDGLTLNWSNLDQFRVSILVQTRASNTPAVISPMPDFNNRINLIP